ncbi:hypothetical protein ABW20_dc0107447 [Dactylellina cionopaga]|nr:hypothetical protein ABW20_dc0107447 [Dactylellina cionopaga]
MKRIQSLALLAAVGTLNWGSIIGINGLNVLRRTDFQVDPAPFNGCSKFGCHLRNGDQPQPELDRKFTDQYLSTHSILDKRHHWDKRAGGKRKRPSSSDDEEAESESDSEDLSNDPWYIRAIAEGKDNEEKEAEVASRPPRSDPPQHDMSDLTITVKKDFPVADAFRDFIALIDQEDVLFYDDAYTRVRIARAGSYIPSLVSAEDSFLIIQWKRSIQEEGIPLSDWMYTCWKIGAPPTDLMTNPRLRYISIVGVANPTTLRQLSAARKMWHRAGNRDPNTERLIVVRSKFPEHDEARLNVWRALRGTEEINSVIKMLYTYPNGLGTAKLSAVRLRFNKAGIPPSVDIFLEVERPRVAAPSCDPMDQDLECDSSDQESQSQGVATPGRDGSPMDWMPQYKSGNRRNYGSHEEEEEETKSGPKDIPYIVVDKNADASPPEKHPFFSDIRRTSYQPWKEPTFRNIYAGYRSDNFGVRTEDIFQFSISSQEHHLIFVGFQKAEHSDSEDLALAESMLGEVMYVAWRKQVGANVAIKDILFATLSPRLADTLKPYIGSKGISSSRIIKWTRESNEFSSILKDLRKLREGKAIETLVETYGETLGRPVIYSLEYGQFAFGDKKKNPFLLVAFSLDNSRADDESGSDLDLYEAPSPVPPQGPTSANRILHNALKGGIEHHLEMTTMVQGLRGGHFQREPENLDPATLLPGFKIETYGKPEPNDDKLSTDCPVTEQLADIWEHHRSILPFLKENKHYVFEADKVARSKYYGVFIGAKGASSNSEKFRLAVSGEFRHVVLVALPREYEITLDGRDRPTLEDFGEILFAAWLTVYPTSKSLILIPKNGNLRTKNQPGAVLTSISILNLSPRCQIIIKSIYKMKKSPQSKSLSLTNPIGFYGSNYETGPDPEGRMYWYLITSCTEVHAAETMFLKYASRMQFVRRFRSIIIRWAEKSGKLEPELFLISDGNAIRSFFQTESQLDVIRRVPDLREISISGDKYALFQRYIYLLAKVPDAPRITDNEYTIQPSAGSKNCPPEVVELVQKYFEGRCSQIVGGYSYFQTSISRTAENLEYTMLVSGTELHLLITNPPAHRGSSYLENVATLAGIYFGAWSAYSNILPEINTGLLERTKQMYIAKVALRVVTFLKISLETESLINSFLVLTRFKGQTDLSSNDQPEFSMYATTTRFKLSINSGPLYEYDSRVRPAFTFLMGLTEVAALCEMLDMYSERMYHQRIVRIAVHRGPLGRIQVFVLFSAAYVK